LGDVAFFDGMPWSVVIVVLLTVLYVLWSRWLSKLEAKYQTAMDILAIFSIQVILIFASSWRFSIFL
jgi:hypothetical protein